MPKHTGTQSTATELIRAIDHLDADESVVRSGMAAADAVLSAYKRHGSVVVSFEGLKGASSSYFNVFLRRVADDCGLSELENYITFEFGSSIQQMVFQRSRDAILEDQQRA